MQLTSYLQNGELTIVLTGEIDHHCAKRYIHAIAAKIEVYTPNVCILDFRDVLFMDSSGIAVVINSLRYMSRLNGELILCGLRDQPKRVFNASGIDKIIKIKEVEYEV